MKTLKLNERLWGSLAHVPTITLIWISYLVYRCFSDPTFMAGITQLSNVKMCPPITPIILTLLGIPISLTIMQLKKTSIFIRSNAHQAYLFNIFLLKGYGLLFTLSFVGIYFSFKPLIIITSILGIVISCICLEQSIMGIITALRGNIYYYWYWYPKKMF